MTFTGTWYKNGPIRKKNTHPFIGNGNIVKYSFNKGKLTSYQQKEVQLPLFQKCLPRIDNKGNVFRNEGNISVIKYKNDLLAMSEMMAPYVLDPETLDTKYVHFSAPCGVHPKVINDDIWNCYCYGNILTIFCNFHLHNVINLEESYYVHDFHIISGEVICVLNKCYIDLYESPLVCLKLSGNSKLLRYVMKHKTYTLYDLPSSMKDHTVTHIANIEKTKYEMKIRCFAIGKPNFRFKQIENPYEYISTPIEISLSDTARMTQYWSIINGDMPVCYNNKIAFVNKTIVYIWSPDSWGMSQYIFQEGHIEEPIWTHTGNLIVLQHTEITTIHIFDEYLNLIRRQEIPKTNPSYHGIWVT